MYMPSKSECKKDFMKMVLEGDKDLLKKKEVTTIKVPHFEELSVKNIWP